MLASPHVGALPLLLLFQASLTLAAEPSPIPTANVILYLSPTHASRIDSRALAEAVRIYTRDLGLAVETIAEDALSSTPATIERVTAILRARGGRLAFWCVSAADPAANAAINLAANDRSVILLSVDARGSVRSDLVASNEAEGSDLYRAVALKLRAILTPSGTRAEAGRAAPRASAAAVAHQEVVPGTAAPTAPAPAPAPASVPRLRAAIEYLLWLAPGSASPRQGLALEVSASPGATGVLEVYASGRLARAADRTTGAGTIALTDLPLRLGVRWVHRSSPVALALGLFGTVHFLSASATSPSGTQDDSSTAGGGGVEARVRIPSSGRLAWELSAWAEAIAPRTQFLVGGSPAIETGRYALGLGVGAAVATR